MGPGRDGGLGASVGAMVAAVVVAVAVVAMILVGGGLHKPLTASPPALAMAHAAPHHG